jgi:single-stranded DNA-binding protein
MSDEQRSQQSNLNVQIISGRLTTAPVLRKPEQGGSFCTVSVRCNYPPYIDSKGNKVTPKPYDRDCELTGKMAENAAQHLITGQAVEIIGEPRQRSWEDPRVRLEADPKGRRWKEELWVRTINYGAKPQSYWNARGTAETETPQVEGGTVAEPAPAPVEADAPAAA